MWVNLGKFKPHKQYINIIEFLFILCVVKKIPNINLLFFHFSVPTYMHIGNTKIEINFF